MSKLQPVQFHDIDDFLAFLPKDQYQIVQALRHLILETIPGVTEKLTYNVPFYYLKKRFCYIWPGVVPWSGVNEGVTIGFTFGYRLKDEYGYLDKGNRKEVYTKTYYTLKEVNQELLKDFLFQSVDLLT